MAWPSKIYVATYTLGVYYTSDFSDPAIQPTWASVNAGLAATDCREFWIDPFDPLNKQYVLLEANRDLYRRDNEGNWATILTQAQLNALAGRNTTTYSFYPDTTIHGRLWALYIAPWNGVDSQVRAAYSNDYGANWSLSSIIYLAIIINGTSNIRSCGANVFAGIAIGAGGNNHVAYSSDSGVTWGVVLLDAFNYSAYIKLNPLLPTQCYGNSDFLGNIDLNKITNAGAVTMLQDGLDSFARMDNMWFNPTVANHQRIIDNSRVYVTTDEWATINAPAAIAPTPISFAPWAGDDTDQMLVGLTLSVVQEHAIGVLYGEADVVATGIAGTNCGVAPYTDSIPETCGGIAQMGIQAINDAFYPVRVKGPNPYRATIKTHHQQVGVSIYASEPVWRT